MQLTHSQTQVAEEIKKLWILKQSGREEVAGLCARTTSVIVGPSGTGKNFVVRHLSREFDLPLFSITPGTWIVLGAKNEDYSLTKLADFVDKNPFGIIFIDEINKLRNSHLREPWATSVFNEILALLDGDQRLCAAKFTPELIAKLQRNFLFTAAGAWQDQWNACKPRPAAGFQESASSGWDRTEAFKAEIVNSSDLLPEELIFRFNESFLFIFPPTPAELAAKITAVRRELKVPPLSSHQLEILVDEAESSGRSMRWLEAYVHQVIDEAGTLKHSLTTMSKIWPGRDRGDATYDKDYPKLYTSVLAIFQKLNLDCMAGARRLQEEMAFHDAYGVDEKLLSGLSDFIEAAEEFASPFNNPKSRSKNFQCVGVFLKGLHKSLCSEKLGCVGPETRRLAIDLRVNLTLLTNEWRRLQRIVSQKDDLIKDEVPDVADHREEWFKRL